MHIALLTSSRRKFLRRAGLLAATAGLPGRPGAHPADPAQSTDSDWLQQWDQLPRHPVREARDPVVTACLAAADEGRTLNLYYQGGDSPGRLRRFSPELVFQVPIHEQRYFSGYCHLRQSVRILRADRIALA